MTCEAARQYFSDGLIGTLHGTERGEYEEHLAACAACREEIADLEKAWDRLGILPEAEPGPEMRSRFHAMLEAYQQGANDAATGERVQRRAWRLGSRESAFRLAAAAALLLAGFFAGRGLGPAQGEPEVSQLRAEMSSMRQLVTLSLLQQQSASKRLQGVTWSYQAAPTDTEVLAALLQTANQDASVNVRLAAVDALRQFGRSPVARKGLVNSLAKQSSPLAQIAVMDALAELNERAAAPALKRLLEGRDLDPNVRQRAEQMLEQWK